MNWKSFLVLIVVAAAAIWGVLQLQQQNTTETTAALSANTPLYPDLDKSINDANKISIVTAGNDTVAELTRSDTGWTIANKSDYPADLEKIRSLLLDLVNTQIREEKTANPDNYSRLGVSDIEQDDAAGKRVDVEGLATPLSLVIGNVASNSGNGTYVRRAGEPQSYLVDKTLAPADDAKQWALQPIVEIPSNRFQRVSIEHADGDSVTVSKQNKTDINFKVFNMLSDRELSHDTVANPIGNNLSNLRLEDVLPVAELNPDEQEDVVTSEFYAFDGLQITAKTFKKDDKYYTYLRASFDEQQAQQFATSESSTENDDEDSKEEEDQDVVQADSDAVKKEAEALDQKLMAWVYEISEFKHTNMTKRLDDLLKPVEETTTEDQTNSAIGTDTPPTLPATLPTLEAATSAATAEESTSEELTEQTNEDPATPQNDNADQSPAEQAGEEAAEQTETEDKTGQEDD